MLFFKVFQELLLPSFLSLILMVLGVILFWGFKKKKTGNILLILGILVYYLFSITPAANHLLLPLENQYPQLELEDIKKADKMVLLLGGRESNVLRASEVLRISYLKGGETPVIISGTDPILPNSQEAWGVKQFFINRGIKEKNIIIESQSRNTRENVENLKEFVGNSPFFLVTSAYHMPRAMQEFKKLGVFPIPAPADFKTKSEKYSFLDFIPDPQNLRNSNLAIHEYFASVYYNLSN